MNVLGMFAKHWRAGRVKTRLARDVGHQAAGRLHRAFVEALLARLAEVGDRRLLACAPDDAVEAFAAVAGAAWDIVPQGSGDLGERMERFFDRAFAAGARRVVLIGSDSPTLPPALVVEAFHLLRDAEVALGPADDGGYYLVGARDATPPIFDGIPWSSADVWPQTLQRLRARGRRWVELPRWYDVDTLADLCRLHADLAGAEPSDAPLARLRETIAAILARKP